MVRSNQTNGETVVGMTSELNRAVRRRLVQVGLTIAVQAGILLGLSGQWNWRMAWVYLAVSVSLSALITTTLMRSCPELIAERGQIKEGAKVWDIWLAGLVGLLLPLLTITVAALDKRFGWTPSLSLKLQVSGLVVLVLGAMLLWRSMLANRFFSGIVRIQADRQHTVATKGPYRYLRHPGYVAFGLIAISQPLIFSSLFTLIPTVLTLLLLIVRTTLEDKTLIAELTGYANYAESVRFRLLPGVW